MGEQADPRNICVWPRESQWEPAQRQEDLSDVSTSSSVGSVAVVDGLLQALP